MSEIEKLRRDFKYYTEEDLDTSKLVDDLGEPFLRSYEYWMLRIHEVHRMGRVHVVKLAGEAVEASALDKILHEIPEGYVRQMAYKLVDSVFAGPDPHYQTLRSSLIRDGIEPIDTPSQFREKALKHLEKVETKELEERLKWEDIKLNTPNIQASYSAPT